MLLYSDWTFANTTYGGGGVAGRLRSMFFTPPRLPRLRFLDASCVVLTVTVGISVKTAEMEAGVAEAVHSACKRIRHVVGCGLRFEVQNISRSRARTSIIHNTFTSEGLLH